MQTTELTVLIIMVALVIVAMIGRSLGVRKLLWVLAPVSVIVVLIGIAALVLQKPPPLMYHGHVVNPGPVVKPGPVVSPGPVVTPGAVVSP